MNILVVNAGSSTHKCKLYTLAPESAIDQARDIPLWEADLDWAQTANRVEVAVRALGEPLHTSSYPSHDRSVVLHTIIESLSQGPHPILPSLQEIGAIGHRVVHGGARFTEAVLINDSVVEELQTLIPLAPAHQPAALEMMAFLQKKLPGVPQVAVFDTAFHRTMPRAASTYPGPYDWVERGLRRFGFHGISYQYLTLRIPQLLATPLSPARMVACHLGNGASVAAIDHGQSLDTSMGFTPLEGLMMGTRSGTIDPGLLLYLLRSGDSLDRLDAMLEQESGLFGLSGIASDLRQVLAAQDAGNDRARLAIEVYVHRCASGIAAMTASLNGIDTLVFTGGVGEHAIAIREQVCAKLEFLGLRLDHAKNQLSSIEDRNIAADSSAVSIFVVHAQEDLMIAHTTRDLCRP